MADLNDIRDEFSPLLDDELSADARHSVEAELAQDSDLLRELDALRKVDDLYRGLPRVSAPDDMAARVQEQLHAKPKVLPLRTRQISRTVYTSLAAAAVFAVLIGGVVLRRSFDGAPATEERFETAARTSDKNDAWTAGKRESAVAESAPTIEADGVVAPEVETVELRQEQAAQPSAPPVQPEALMHADATASSGNLPDAAPKDDRAVGEAKERPATMAALPPPPPPAPVEGSVQTTDEGSAMTEETEAPMTGRADADMADASEFAESRRGIAKKSESVIDRIADREFEKRNDGWYERSYNGEPVQTVRRGSESLNALASTVPKLSEILALEGEIVFQHAKKWYRVPADST